MRYTHIVFDVDGTLIDTFYSNMQSLRDTLLTLTGEDHSLESLSRYFGMTGMDTMADLALPDPVGALRLWEEKLLDYRHTDRVYDGIPELLEALTRAGCALGVATSRTRAEFDLDFSTLDIARYFPVTICADDTLRHKPDADPLLKYMEKAGAKREEVLYIGDSAHDMACAAAAGVAGGLAVWGAVGPRESTYRFETPADAGRLILGEGAGVCD